MDSVIVYGSLLDPDAITDVFGGNATTTLVKVHGYRRCFDQRAAYRDDEGGANAVLNVVPDEATWHNAVLVSGFDAEHAERYREREAGYDLVSVPMDRIEPYGEETLPEVDETYIAKGQRFTEYPRPIPSYVAECLEGAESWGEEFLADFVVQTTRS